MPSVQPRPVNQVGVVGAGIMGAGIAGAHVRRGIPATDARQRRRPPWKRASAAITKVIQSRIEIGRMTPDDMTSALAQLSTSLTLAALADRDVVIEAIVENEGVKTKLFGELQKILPAGRHPGVEHLDDLDHAHGPGGGPARRTSPACTSSTRSIACSWWR